MPTMIVATKLRAMVSDSGEPILSLMTDRKVLTLMTTAMAVARRTSQRAGPVSTGIRRQFGSRGDSAALVSRLTQNTTPMTVASALRNRPMSPRNTL